MDCLVSTPGGERAVLPPAAVFAACPASLQSAAVPSTCIVGSPHVRCATFLPRLHSIPEAAEHTAGARTAASAALTALGSSRSECHMPADCITERPDSSNSSSSTNCQQSTLKAGTQQQQDSFTGDADDAASCSSSHAACCSSASLEGTRVGEIPDQISPAVVANTWAINIRHFTDCVPIAADSVCSTSTCHTTSLRGSGEASSSQVQEAQQGSGCPQQQQQQPLLSAASRSVPRTSSCSSLLPAAEEESMLHSEPPLLEALSLKDMDALEWQPWDRVALWLDAHTETAAALSGKAAVPAACRESPKTGSSKKIKCATYSSPDTRSDPADLQQELQQQAGDSSRVPCTAGGGDEVLFDAPDWWQESVKARLEEQREAFQSSWWCRLKILTGLAAQRASCELHV